MHIYRERNKHTSFQDSLQNGYSAHILVKEYLCDVIPRKSRDGVRILDVGAGSGLVAKEVC